MNSPTSTTFDLSDTESSGAPSRPPSPAPTFNSRHYIRDDVAIFKVANQLFRIHRTLLDEETDMIPRGEDPIELTNIKPGDFEILLDFLNLGTRHDKKPLTAVDWASVIAVSSIYGMQRVLNLACKSVMDQQKTLLDQQETLLDQQKILSDGQKNLSDQQQAFLDQQKAFLDQQNAPLNVSCAGVGFERETYGMYFLIREKGTTHYLHTYWASNTEGTQVQLRDRENALNVFNGVFNSMVFFIDKYGALHHAASGLAVDIVDDVPVLRRNRPSSSSPNPWSRPLPEFSFVNSQIRVKFLSDPSLPSCPDPLYPNGSWGTKDFVLAVRPEKDFHMHPISDFSPWIPPPMVGSFAYNTGANHDKKWRVLVEERAEDVGGARTSWEIVAATKV